jgi:hypothetical protein
MPRPPAFFEIGSSGWTRTSNRPGSSIVQRVSNGYDLGRFRCVQPQRRAGDRRRAALYVQARVFHCCVADGTEPLDDRDTLRVTLRPAIRLDVLATSSSSISSPSGHVNPNRWCGGSVKDDAAPAAPNLASTIPSFAEVCTWRAEVRSPVTTVFGSGRMDAPSSRVVDPE